MKLLVFSDSHGMPLYMRETLEKHRDADAVIFLGDGQKRKSRECKSRNANARELRDARWKIVSKVTIRRERIWRPVWRS